jgi:hypothetical protein
VRVRSQKTVLSTILLCFGFNPSLRGMQDREQENAAAHVKPADRPALIQGKTIEAWLAALKDSDPAVRKRAIEVLGRAALIVLGAGNGTPRPLFASSVVESGGQEVECRPGETVQLKFTMRKRR